MDRRDLDDIDWRRLLEGALGTPATEGNRVEVLRDGVEIFPAMLEAIRGAERNVDLLTFVYWRGRIAERFADALIDRAREGVRCRVILDALGARHVETHLIESMEQAGVQVHWFRPLVEPGNLRDPGRRTHRKVLVCDELVGFVGGIGIAEEWDGCAEDGTGWRETQVRVRGPAVDGLRAAFLDDWFESDHPLLDARDQFPVHEHGGSTTAMVVRGEAEEGRSDLAMLRELAFERARRRIRITTPYFAPDDRLLGGLQAAARRGVTVQVLVPGDNNDKTVAQLVTERYAACLLDAGVELYHYLPTMLHAKVITIDGEVAIVGSANLNRRSLRIDEEVDLVVFDADVTAVLDRHSDADLARCHRVDHAEVESPERRVRAPLRVLSGLIERWT